MTQPDNRIPMHHPQTAARVFSGEAVIITPAENKVRMLNTVGSRVWELADGTRTVDEIAGVLARNSTSTRPRPRTAPQASSTSWPPRDCWRSPDTIRFWYLAYRVLA